MEKTKEHYLKLFKLVDLVTVAITKVVSILTTRVLDAITKATKNAPELFQQYAAISSALSAMIAYSHTLTYAVKTMLRRLDDPKYVARKKRKILETLNEFNNYALMAQNAMTYFARVYDPHPPPIKEEGVYKIGPINDRISNVLRDIKELQEVGGGVEAEDQYNGVLHAVSTHVGGLPVDDRHIINVGGADYPTGEEAEQIITEIAVRVTRLAELSNEEEILREARRVVPQLADVTSIVDLNKKLTGILNGSVADFLEAFKTRLEGPFADQYVRAEKLLKKTNSSRCQCALRDLIAKLDKKEAGEAIALLEKALNLKPALPVVSFHARIAADTPVRTTHLLFNSLVEFAKLLYPVIRAVENYYIEKARILCSALDLIEEKKWLTK